jgi:hypothetical protein
MANTNPTARVTTGKLNTVDDSAIGGASSTTGVSGRAPGQLGQIIELSEVEAQKMDSALHGGKYQYVKFKAGTTQSNAKGQLVAWDDIDDFVVTPDPTTAGLARIAGVALNAVTKGQYGWIQVSGLATCKCKAAVTTTTDGTVAIAVSDTTINVDSLADATATTNLQLKAYVGNFAEAPANGALKLVQLTELSERGA